MTHLQRFKDMPVISWLKYFDQDAYQFVVNRYINGHITHMPISIDDLFSWRDQPQGSGYWEALEDEWCDSQRCGDCGYIDCVCDDNCDEEFCERCGCFLDYCECGDES